MYPSHLSKDEFVPLDKHFWKNARLMPVLLWFCLYFWLSACSELYWAVWDSSITLWMCSGLAAARDRQNLNFIQLMPDVLLKESARLSPVFLQKWTCLRIWVHWILLVSLSILHAHCAHCFADSISILRRGALVSLKWEEPVNRDHFVVTLSWCFLSALRGHHFLYVQG